MHKEDTAISSDTATVFVIDDMRISLESILSNAGIAARCFRAPSEFLDCYRSEMAGCLVIDVELPEMDGLELCARLQETDCALPFIVISGFANVPRVLNAFRQGAVDFLEKPFGRAQLLECVERAIQSDTEARRRQQKRIHVMARVESLTPRENEVLRLLSQGLEAKQIAGKLGISPKTAHNHRAHILEKMEVDNVPKLVRLLQVFD